MATSEKTVEALLYEALEAKSEPVLYAPAALDAKADRLVRRYAELRAAAAFRERLAGALLDPIRRSGWLDGVAAALKIIVGAVPNSSRILVEAAFGAEPWNFAAAAAGALRGAGDEARIDAALPTGAAADIVIDDLGDERRILATIRKFPAAAPPPVMLLIGADAGPVEIDPDIQPDRTGTATLRYEALVPSGEFSVFWGNPRS